jgi:hypothetical protein
MCSGCSEEVSQGLNMAKDIAGTAIKSEIAPDSTVASNCKSNLANFATLLNGRNGLMLKEWLAPDTPYQNVRENYNALVDDNQNKQLNGLVFDGFVSAVFDEKLNINYHTISDISFEVKDIVDLGGIMRGHATMTNNNQQTDVIVVWHPMYKVSDGVWMVYSIKSDE